MVEYYKDGAIHPELVTKMAQNAAQSFFSGPRDELKASQLRKFYGDVKTLELRYKNSTNKKSAFQEILPLIKLLKAKSAYANSREVIPATFKNWIWENVDSISSEKDFLAFLLYFEAVVGFCHGLKGKNYN